jgi:transcriptional regulator with XRE-family HTH domain
MKTVVPQSIRTFMLRIATPTQVPAVLSNVRREGLVVIAKPVGILATVETAETDAGDLPTGKPFADLVDRTEMPAANDAKASGGPTSQPGARARRSAAVDPDAAAAIRESRKDMPYRRVFGDRLRKAREASGLGQFEAARLLDFTSPAQWSLWEGSKRLPNLSEIVKVARLLNVSIGYLLGESDDEVADPAASLRDAVLRGVRAQLTRATEIVCDEVARHTRLVGGNVATVEGVIVAGDALLNAVANFQRINIKAVEDMKGSATLVWASEGFERELLGARQKIRLAQALDNDLRRALSGLSDLGSATPEGPTPAALVSQP